MRTMKSTRFLIAAVCLLFAWHTNAQTEVALIAEALTDYIEGSTNGQPERLRKVFHPDLNLYYVKNDSLRVWSGSAYIESTKEGEPTGEVGKIMSIDYENDIAVAKVQITYPGRTPYIDYFMLLKLGGQWTIMHKMFTKQTNE